MKDLKKREVKLLTERNKAISNLNKKVAKIKALEMEQKLTMCIKLKRKKIANLKIKTEKKGSGGLIRI